MTTILDVAEVIVGLVPSVRTDWLKLQKLTYYSQVWSLIWDGRPLFSEPFEAWKNGPASTLLYSKQRYDNSVFNGDPTRVSQESRKTIEAVVAAFGDKPGQWLSELVHREQPWVDARGGLPAEAPGNTVITHAAMTAWYSQLAVPPKNFPEAVLRGFDFLVDTPVDEVALLSAPAVDGAAYLNWLENGDTSWPERS